MAGFKLSPFMGLAPKIAPELLPNNAAQIARNCKLYSGDLIPYPQPVIVDNTDRTGTINTLYALRNPSNVNDLKWLSWTTDVDIATLASTEADEQRFYYTGDGVPKVSNYALATAGAPPYPTGYYDLGLPLPTQVPVATPTVFTQKDSASFFRDAGGVATITTSASHNLRSGNIVTISGFTSLTGTYNQAGTTTITITLTAHGLSNGATVTLDFTSGAAIDGTFTISNVAPNTFDITVVTVATTSGNVNLDLRGFNATNVEVTVTTSTAFTYFSPGFQIGFSGTPITYTDAKIDLAGLTQERTYTYTWYTPWEEESIGSDPSAPIYLKEGTTVTVSNLPIAAPSGNNFVRGIRLYRTLPSASGTEFFLLNTLWFPTAIARVQRTSNVSRVTLAQPHNMADGDRFKISGCSVASFDITGGIVTTVVDQYTFEYTQVAADVADTAATGTLYHDVSENPPTTAAVYWGDGTYDFTDDFDSNNLTTILASDNYDAPPDDLQGIVAIQNNVMCGFVGKKIYFSEPGLPHAWPADYAVTVEANVVAVVAFRGAVMALTEAYPYLIQGTDPAAGMTPSRIDAPFPCLNRRGVVTMNYGTVYPTHDGLALVSPDGTSIVTRALFNNDTWGQTLDPSTIVAEYYGENYFASHSGGGIIFEQDQRTGGFFVETDYSFSASWYDYVTGKLYYVSGTNGDIYQWDDLDQPSVTQEWKSKVLITKGMMNFGAARVVADYAAETATWDQTTTLWNGTSTLWSSVDPVTFKMWVDKALIFTTTLSDGKVFRLPTGYRTDTVEVGVEGNIRIRAIHVAETSFGLREV
jgi:hypothetical protein